MSGGPTQHTYSRDDHRVGIGSLYRFARWVVTRIGWGLLVIWVVATIVFFAMRATGDPLEAIMGGPGSQAGEAAVASARAQYGLDQPVIIQYLLQLWRVGTLQLGDSYARKQPVANLILAQLPNTIILATFALILAWLLALVAATACVRGSRNVRRALNACISVIGMIATVMPQFWLGAVLILIFVSKMSIFPATSASNTPRSLLLPVVTLAVPTAGFLFNVLRDSLIHADGAPFAVTSRSRGAGEWWVLVRHTLRHASLPCLALSGWAYGSLLSGAVVVESLFARPGLGRLLLEGASARDVPLTVGAIVVVALIYVIVMVLSDVIELLIDPRLVDRAMRARADIGVGA